MGSSESPDSAKIFYVEKGKTITGRGGKASPKSCSHKE